MTIKILGIGWLTRDGFGCIRTGLRHRYEQGEDASILPKKGIFSHPFKNFGRLDAVSRMTVFGVSLALQDGGIEYSSRQKQDVGLLATGTEGSLATDREYFLDYLKSGRTLSRGNLFIYTLPSSPIGEAAIHFGLRGPTLYAAGRNGLAETLELAGEMIAQGQARAMLAGTAGTDDGMFLIMQQDGVSGKETFCELEEARSFADPASGTPELVDRFLRMAARKG